jgi:hypothetical protein
MLLRMRQLRNRVIRVVGYSRLTTTMKALEEAGSRISRYLLMQVQKVELPKLVLPGAESELPRVQVSILGCPAHDEADEIALAMLGRLLDPERTELEIVPSEILSSEVISRVREKNPSIICVGSLDPDPVGPIRYLCKRMRERYPSVRILVGRWGTSPKPASERDQLIAAGADYVSTSLIEAHNQLTHLMPIAESEAHARQQLRAATIP